MRHGEVPCWRRESPIWHVLPEVTGVGSNEGFFDQSSLPVICAHYKFQEVRGTSQVVAISDTSSLAESFKLEEGQPRMSICFKARVAPYSTRKQRCRPNMRFWNP